MMFPERWSFSYLHEGKVMGLGLMVLSGVKKEPRFLIFPSVPIKGDTYSVSLNTE